jgi:proline iminopeptidase
MHPATRGEKRAEWRADVLLIADDRGLAPSPPRAETRYLLAMPPIPAPRADGHTSTTPVPLYWAAHGREGGPQLIVLHGGPGAHHDYLLPQMLELGDEYDLLFYDQRGGGRSRTDSPDPIGWQTHVDDLTAVIAELADGPLSIIGYSWGGLLALLYLIAAARGPGLVPPRRLVLIDPAPTTRHFRTRFESEFSGRQRGAPVAALRTELDASGLRERDPAAHRQRMFELSVAGYFADPAAARELTPFRVIGKVQQSVWSSLGDYDVVRDLEALAHHPPALVIHGREDPIPLESSIETANAIGAELVVIEGSGHVPYVEQPEQLFSAMRRFLHDTDHLARG